MPAKDMEFTGVLSNEPRSVNRPHIQFSQVWAWRVNSPATKCRISDLDDNVFGILDLGNRSPLNGNFQLAFEDNCLHGTFGRHLGAYVFGEISLHFWKLVEVQLEQNSC
jgi:hypothetical protein